VVEDDLIRGTPPCHSDLDDLVALFTNPRVGETLGGVRSPERTRATLERWQGWWSKGSPGPLIFRFSETNQFFGIAGLAPADHVKGGAHELIYALEPDFWGQGLATRASKLVLAKLGSAPGVDEIIAFTLPTNRASRRVLEKVGFVYEGPLEHAGDRHVLYRLPRPLRDA